VVCENGIKIPSNEGNGGFHVHDVAYDGVVGSQGFNEGDGGGGE